MATTKERLDWAFKNRGKNPAADEYVKRYKDGLLNPELTKDGMQPVPITKPRFDFSKVNLQDAMKGQEGGVGGNTYMTEVAAQGEKTRADLPEDITTGIKQIGEDVTQRVQNYGDIIFKKEPDLYPGQKMVNIAENTVGGAFDVVGRLIQTGVKAAFMTPEQEASTKKFIEEKVNESGFPEWLNGQSTAVQKEIMYSLDSLDIIPLKLGAVTKGVLNTSEDIISQGKKMITDVVTTSQKNIENDIVSTFEKSIKPNLQSQQTLGQAQNYKTAIVDGVKTIEQNKNNLQFVDETGELITGRAPRSLQEFSESIDQSKKQIYEQYDNLATQAGEQGVKIDNVKIANELESVINNQALKLSNPEAVQYATQVRDRFLRAGEIDAKTAQEIIQNYNNSLKAFYKNPTPDGLTKNAVDALMVNQMRKSLDEGIEGLTGAQYQALKNQYASLKTIERDVLRATLRDARKNQKGLIDYTDIFSGGQLVTGLLTLNPAMIAQGAAQKGFAEWFKFLNDPNRMVEQTFELAGKLEKTAPTTPISTRKQLPAPREGAADVSIYTPIELNEKPQSAIDFSESQNPNIGTTAKGYPSSGDIPVNGNTEVETVPIKDNANQYYPPSDSLPVIKTGKNESAVKSNLPTIALGAGLAAYYSLNEDGSLMPIMALGTLNPQVRKIIVKELDDAISVQRRIVADTTNSIGYRKAAQKNVNQLMKQKADLISKQSFNSGEIPQTNSASSKLETEAKKYKSAEEFVKAQGTPVYHGTSAKFDEFRSDLLGVNTNAGSAREGFFFATSKENALHYKPNTRVANPDVAKSLNKDLIANLAKKGLKTRVELPNSSLGYYQPTVVTPQRLTLDDFGSRLNGDIKEQWLNQGIADLETKKRLISRNSSDEKWFDDVIATYKETVKDSLISKKSSTSDRGELKVVYLNYKNPKILTDNRTIEGGRDLNFKDEIKKAKEEGYDAVIIKNTKDPLPTDVHVVFSAEQIKTKSQLVEIWNKANGK